MADIDPDQTREPLLSPALTRSQAMSVWAGVAAAALGCSAWMLAMAALGGDWMAFGVTVLLVLLLVFVFGKLCLRHALKRFPLLAVMMVLITVHCLAMYWWRFDIWRAGAEVTPDVLMREKRMVTFTIATMVSLLLAQFGFFYWLASRSRKNRAATAGRNKL